MQLQIVITPYAQWTSVILDTVPTFLLNQSPWLSALPYVLVGLLDSK